MLRTLARDLDNQNGTRAAATLSLTACSDADRRRVLGACAQAGSRFEQQVANAVPHPWRDIVATSLRAAHALLITKQFDVAFKSADACFEAVREFIGEARSSNWWLPLVNYLLGQYRVAAVAADRASVNKKESNTGRFQSVVTQIYPVFLRDDEQGATSKRFGVLSVINHLFKMSFQIRNLRMCSTFMKNIHKSIEDKLCPPIEAFPLAHGVFFNYYSGRMLVFEEKYIEAERALNSAFLRCHASAVRNKRRILEFLIPVKLRLGRFPARRLLEKYDLMQFAPLTRAIQVGDLRAFNEALREHQEFFVRKGIFLILDQTKTYVYRNLFRKAYVVHKSLAKDKEQWQVPLALFKTALDLNGLVGDDAIDADELECILATLISQRYMQGYIAHKAGKVVVDRNTPFPKLADVVGGKR